MTNDDMTVCQGNLASAIFRAVDNGIVIVDYEREKIVDANPAACIIFGVEYDDLIGSSCSQYLCDLDGNQCPLKSMDTCEQRDTYLNRSRLTYIRGDGTEVHLIKSAVTLIWRGEYHLVCNLVDVTEELKLTEELRHQRNMARLYMDVAQDVFLALDLDGNIKFINKKGCEILKVDEWEVIGKSWFDNFVPESELYKVKKEFSNLLTSDDAAEFESWVVNSQGELRLLRWKNVSVRGTDGCVNSTFSSGEDITDIKRAEMELEKYWRKVESELQNNISKLKARSVAG